MKSVQNQRFSILIREARLKRGLTIRNLEAAMKEHGGLAPSRTLISFLETEKRKPTYEVAYALAMVLDIDVNIALAAAFQARRRFDFSRERQYLEDLVNNLNLRSVDIKTVMRD